MTEAPVERPILTPDQRVRVFVSSTLEELAAERAAVREAVDTPPPVAGAVRARRPRPSAAQPLPLVPRAEPRVRRASTGSATAGWRRRWTCRASRTSTCSPGAKPKLMYVKRPAPGREPRLDGPARPHPVRRRRVVQGFADAAELEALVADDLAMLLSEAFLVEPGRRRRRRPTSGSPCPARRRCSSGASAELDEVRHAPRAATTCAW